MNESQVDEVRKEMEERMAAEIEERVTQGVTTGITILITVAITFVIAIVVFKFVWGWVIGDLFPGAVAQGLISANLTWLQALKLAVLVAVLSGFGPTLTEAFNTRS
jgi:hypothetical protein